MYKSRINSNTTIDYDGNIVTIIQTGEDWGDPWPVPSSYISFSEIGKMIEALKDIQKINYGKW